MIIRTSEQLAMRLSPIIHILLTEDYGIISDFMNRYIEFLRSYYPDNARARKIENEMVMLYHTIHDYLMKDDDRSVALLHHLQENSIEFYNGELLIGKIEVEYEENPV